MTISVNLKRLMEREKINASELGRSIKLAQPIIHRLLTGKNVNPKLATIRPIADYFDVTISQLIGEDLLVLDNQVGEGSTWKQVPVLSWGDVVSVVDGEQKVIVSEQVSTDACVSESAYAVVIENTGLEPHFPKGAKVVVEPMRQSTDSDFLVVITGEGGDPHIRQVVSDGADSYLKSLNPALSKMNMVRLENAHKILGVVVQVKLYY
jgi:SOS-response transcriptional repressor LexA